jgi:hypothetical protein
LHSGIGNPSPNFVSRTLLLYLKTRILIKSCAQSGRGRGGWPKGQERSDETVDGRSQIEIALRETAGIVADQGQTDFVIADVDVRMMP